MEKKVYEIAGVNRHSKTTVRGEEIEYVSLALQEKGRNIFKSSNTDPFVNIFGSNANDKRKIELVKACKDDNDKYDPAKLKALGDVEGYFATLSVSPYYVKDREGNYMKYPDGHPDKGKPMISTRISVFVWAGDESSLEEIKTMNMGNRELVPTTELDPNRYASASAKLVLRKAQAEETARGKPVDDESIGESETEDQQQQGQKI